MADEEHPYNQVAGPLGNFIMSFNDLELATGIAIMNMLDLDERVGAVFTAMFSFAQKLQLIHALEFRIEGHPYRDRFLQLMGSAQKLGEHRNKYVHAEYFPILDAEKSIVVAMRRIRDATKPLYGTDREPFKNLNVADAQQLTYLAQDAFLLAAEMATVSETFRKTV